MREVAAVVHGVTTVAYLARPDGDVTCRPAAVRTVSTHSVMRPSLAVAQIGATANDACISE